jgi:hypothetical protein
LRHWCWVLFGRFMGRRNSGGYIKAKPDAPNECPDLAAIYLQGIPFTSPCVAIVVSF